MIINLFTLRKIVIIIFGLIPAYLLAQDIHYSQFFNTPILINPAYTGYFDGDWQVSAAYRNQWKSIAQPFRTLFMDYERQFYIKNHHISGGAYLFNDRSGDVALSATQFVLSGAYHTTIYNHQINGGIQIGYMNKSVDYGNNTFPGQFDYTTGGFNPNMGGAPANSGERLSYFDVNVGFGWRKKIGKFQPEGGFSVFHLNRPKESFYDNDVRLPLKSSFNAALKIDLSTSLYVFPRFVLMSQSKARNFLVGSEVGYALTSNSAGVRQIYGGIYTRNTIVNKTDAMVFNIGVLVRNISIGISYDINVSTLKEYTNNRGAFELTFIYRSLSTILNTFTIPCERY